MAISLVHFARRITPTRPARHYLGYAEDVAQRLAEHAAGCGCRGGPSGTGAPGGSGAR